jgi:hypothetical protein
MDRKKTKEQKSSMGWIDSLAVGFVQESGAASLLPYAPYIFGALVITFVAANIIERLSVTYRRVNDPDYHRHYE